MSALANDPECLKALAARLLESRTISQRQYDLWLYVDLHNYSVKWVRQQLYAASLSILYRDLNKVRFAMDQALIEAEEGETRLVVTLKQGHQTRSSGNPTQQRADRMLGLRLVTAQTRGAEAPAYAGILAACEQ